MALKRFDVGLGGLRGSSLIQLFAKSGNLLERVATWKNLKIPEVVF
jgi:hypothetical protein